MTTRNPLAVGLRHSESTVELEQQIQRRAYQLYEQRGREDGHHLDDWLQAEDEIRGKAQAKAA